MVPDHRSRCLCVLFRVRISSQHLLGLKTLKEKMGVGGKEGRDGDEERREGWRERATH